jgi:hypothetical protein
MGFHTSYLYDRNDIQLYKTAGYGGSDADVSDVEQFSGNIDLTVDSGTVVDIVFDGSNDMDDLILSIYRRRDDDWQGIERAIGTPIVVSNDGTESIYNLAIGKSYGPGNYRIEMKSSGTNTVFDVLMQARSYRDTRSIA